MSFFDKFKKSSPAKIEWIIVGLGNPGQKYERSRHNMGFMTIDLLCAENKVRCDRLKFKALYGEITLGGQRALLVKPQTFMNLSGEAVREIISWYKLPTERLIVVHDDAAIPPGKLRIRSKGSDGGHNGIKSIIFNLETDAFTRVKIGVGSPENKNFDLVDWVLGSLAGKEAELITDAIKRAAKAVGDIISDGADRAANKYN